MTLLLTTLERVVNFLGSTIPNENAKTRLTNFRIAYSITENESERKITIQNVKQCWPTLFKEYLLPQQTRFIDQYAKGTYCSIVFTYSNSAADVVNVFINEERLKEVNDNPSLNRFMKTVFPLDTDRKVTLRSTS
jgi:hypothetical protein